MGVYQFKKEMILSATLEKVWDFISTPQNLSEITPDTMAFDIISENLPEKMYPGLIILYRIKLFPGISTRWVTEITQVKEKEYFVDEQRSGPYAIWHHEHFISPVTHGVLMKDIVTYKPPLGWIGSLANRLYIQHAIRKIFDYRTTALLQVFKPS